MFKGLSGLVLFACFFLSVSIPGTAQCGSSLKMVIQNCGSHCGTIETQSCEGVGTHCEDNTGPQGAGCCGVRLLLPGVCRVTKALPAKELVPSEEFLAFREALALRKNAFPAQTQIMIVSCAPDWNAFNEWLQAKLKQQQR